jgi:3-oxoadipate enol-lactonase
VPRARVDGVELYWERGGEGAPVVYIHGGFPSLATRLAGFDGWTWTWEEDFARRFDFVWYDRRGCYRSASPAEGYDLENQARDLAGLLDHLRLASAHLIGSSAGGPIGIVFAARWPHRTRSLVLAGTGLDLFPRGDPVSELIRAQLALLQQAGPDAAFDQRPAGVEATFGSLWARAEAEARGRLDAYLERERVLNERAQRVPRAQRVHQYAVELRGMQAYMERDVRADARQIACPTLVLHGSDDRDVPLAWGEALTRTVPAAELRVLEGGGHSLIHRSDEGRRIAIEFIQRQVGRAASAA